MLRMTKKAFRSYVWNNQTKERGDVKERNQTAELLFGLLLFFLVKEMTSVIGNGRAKVKEEHEAMTGGSDATTWGETPWPKKTESLRLSLSNQPCTN